MAEDSQAHAAVRVLRGSGFVQAVDGWAMARGMQVDKVGDANRAQAAIQSTKLPLHTSIKLPIRVARPRLRHGDPHHMTRELWTQATVILPAPQNTRITSTARTCDTGIHSHWRMLLTNPVMPPPAPPWKNSAARYSTSLEVFFGRLQEITGCYGGWHGNCVWGCRDWVSCKRRFAGWAERACAMSRSKRGKERILKRAGQSWSKRAGQS